MLLGTYVSGDELERAEAFQLGYPNVFKHPNEIQDLPTYESLIFDFDHAFFGDHEAILRKANDAATLGVKVGIHTYYPNDPRLENLQKEWGIVIAKTHQDVLDQIFLLTRIKESATEGERVGSES